MAKLTDVPNGKLCKNIKKSMIQTYVDFVETFTTKYANQTTITIPTEDQAWQEGVDA